MRRILFTLLFALIMTTSALAAGFSIGDAKYEILPDGTVMLKSYKNPSGKIEIPEKVADPKKGTEYTVTAIGKDALAKSQIKQITLPSTINTIREGAFRNTTLENINIPEGVKIIEKNVFRGCKWLTDCNWPESITYIPEYAFYECAALKQFSFGHSLKSIEKYAFSQSGLVTVQIPSGVNDLGWYSFSDCKNLITLVIDDSFSPLSIGFNSFSDDPISTVYVGRNLIVSTNLNGESAPFIKNDYLRNITIGESLNNFPDEFLSGCKNLINLTVGDFDNPATKNLLKTLRKKSFGYNGPSEKLQCTFLIEGEPISINIQDYEDFEDFLPIVRDYYYSGMSGSSDYRRNEAAMQYYYTNRTSKFLEFNKITRIYLEMATAHILANKDSINETQVSFCSALSNDHILDIAIDYDTVITSFSEWVSYHFPEKPNESVLHGKQYQSILDLSEIFLKADSKKYRAGGAYQLMALCGLGQWEDAAKYYPTACKIATENGKYAVPSDFTHFKKMLSNKGYTVKDPVYKKATASKGKKGKGTSVDSDNASLVQFFGERLLNAGINHYQKKRAEKKAQERFYESMGLDKKGRPKK